MPPAQPTPPAPYQPDPAQWVQPPAPTAPAGPVPGQPLPAPAPTQDDWKTKFEETAETVNTLTQTVEELTAKIATPAPATVTPPAEDAWKPSSWDDVVNKTAKTVLEGIQTTTQEQQTEAQKAQENQRKVDQYVETELGKIEASGYLPPITNVADDNDPGKIARRELIGLAIAANSDNLGLLAQQLYAAHQGGYSFDYQKGQWVPSNQVGKPATAPTQTPDMWGNVTGPASPVFQPAPVNNQPNPVYLPQPVAPQPAGLTAPVGSSNAQPAVVNGRPNASLIRNAQNLDQVTEMFRQYNP